MSNRVREEVTPIKKSIDKAKKGNKNAFIACTQPYEADIYRMAFVYMKNEHDALDVMQEAIIKAYESLDTLREPDYFKTWLIRIVINCCISKLKLAKKVVHIEPKQVDLWQVSDHDIPLKVTLETLINDLSLEEKNVVLLRFYQGYTFEDISDVLEIPLGTAKSLLYRALKKLRLQIEEVDFYE